MSILRDGGHHKDWVRGHVDCTWDSPDVIEKPESKPILRPAPKPTDQSQPPDLKLLAEIRESLQQVQAGALSELRVVSDPGPSRNPDKHKVILDAATVLAYASERMAYGACDALNKIRNDPKLRRAVLGE